MGKPTDILQGTLDMLILKAASLGPLHGYGLLIRIQQLSSEVLNVPQGSLYPALYRLVGRGWITSEWGTSENRRKARFYSLTAKGKRQLESETEHWRRLSEGVAGVLRARPEQV